MLVGWSRRLLYPTKASIRCVYRVFFREWHACKNRIRLEIKNDPKFVDKHHLLGLGTRVRNALRMGGFFYNPHTMDGIWFGWLKEAVCLPEDKIILTDSMKERIERYNASLDKARKLEEHKILLIKHSR